MKTPEWIKPAIYGAAAGAVALAVVGFSWGGWVTAGKAQKLASETGSTAVVTAMTPYCIAQSKADPNSTQVLAALKAASSYERSGILAKAGWATPLGAKEPNSDLAEACTIALALN